MRREISDREKKRDEYLKVISLKATAAILEYLTVHGDTHYTELQKLTSTYTLTMRLRSLRKVGLVEHHIKKEKTRKEWYTITEKGRKVLRIIQKISEILEENNEK